MNDFTIVSEPFTWNDNMAEEALEYFDSYRKDMSYQASQTIGLALAKLELLEKQGCEVRE